MYILKHLTLKTQMFVIYPRNKLTVNSRIVNFNTRYLIFFQILKTLQGSIMSKVFLDVQKKSLIFKKLR